MIVTKTYSLFTRNNHMVEVIKDGKVWAMNFDGKRLGLTFPTRARGVHYGKLKADAAQEAQ